MDTCIHMAESSCCPPETITTLWTGCTSIQNKKLKKNSSWTTLKIHLRKRDSIREFFTLNCLLSFLFPRWIHFPLCILETTFYKLLFFSDPIWKWGELVAYYFLLSCLCFLEMFWFKRKNSPKKYKSFFLNSKKIIIISNATVCQWSMKGSYFTYYLR